MIVDTKNLKEALEAYKTGKLMRKDMFLHVVDAIAAIDERLKAIETGETSRRAAAQEMGARLHEIEKHLGDLDDEIDTKVATAANSAVNIIAAMQNGGQNGGAPAPKRVGRPPGPARVEA